MEEDWNDLDLTGLSMANIETSRCTPKSTTELDLYSEFSGSPANYVDEKTGARYISQPRSSDFCRSTATPIFKAVSDRVGSRNKVLRLPSDLPHREGESQQVLRAGTNDTNIMSTSKDQFEGDRMKERLRQGLQPRRRPPNARHHETVVSWQSDQSKVDETLQGLEIPDFPALRLKKGIRDVANVVAFESDNEDWPEGSIGIRHASRSERQKRTSASSSTLSASHSSTGSSAVLEGLELPRDIIDLRTRFQHNTDRRAAGDTIRCRPRNQGLEDHFDGLVIDNNSFLKGRGSFTAEQMEITAVRSNKADSDNKEKSRARLAMHISDNLKPAAATRGHPHRSTDDRLRVPTEIRRVQSRTSLATPHSESGGQAVENRSDTRLCTSDNRSRTPRSTATKPAFLPSGAAGEFSHHISARNQRLERPELVQKPASTRFTSSSPSKRRATASEALRAEASRVSTRAHIRAKTYGEGNELDEFEDLPTTRRDNQTLRSHRPERSAARAPAPLDQLLRFQESRMTPTSGKQLSQNKSYHKGTNLESSSARKLTGEQGRLRRKPALPGLISGINTTPVKKREKNMVYNPTTFRWEGNEDIMDHFDSVIVSPPRPALISYKGASQPSDRHVVENKMALDSEHGMVFLPDLMCWVKISEDESEIDPFEGLDDLLDQSSVSQTARDVNVSSQVSQGQFTIGEEFDVGRQFIRRQRDEEIRWRAITRSWLSEGSNGIDRSYLQDIYNLLTEED